jgi:hypothetical protein
MAGPDIHILQDKEPVFLKEKAKPNTWKYQFHASGFAFSVTIPTS